MLYLNYGVLNYNFQTSEHLHKFVIVQKFYIFYYLYACKHIGMHFSYLKNWEEYLFCNNCTMYTYNLLKRSNVNKCKKAGKNVNSGTGMYQDCCTSFTLHALFNHSVTI